MDGRSLSGYQPKRVWLNDGAGQFVDVAQAVGVTDIYDGRAVALVDLWNRGVLDVGRRQPERAAAASTGTPSTPSNQWIVFELEGTSSNRSAIGAQVTLFWNGQKQVQEVSGGSGFCAQNQRRLHFGLGQEPQVEQAVIRWPSGKRADARRPSARTSSTASRSPHERPSRSDLACRSLRSRAPPRRSRRCSAVENRYLAPVAHHLHPARRAPVVRHPGELLEDAAGDRRRASSLELVLGRHLLRQVAAPGQRLHHRHQRRHPDPLAGLLAVRAVQPRSRSRRSTCCGCSGRHLWNPSNFGICAMLFLAARPRRRA